MDYSSDVVTVDLKVECNGHKKYAGDTCFPHLFFNNEILFMLRVRCMVLAEKPGFLLLFFFFC